ncbi:hypothetical protein ACROYT_G024670, partial [Oculina patagonica]
GNLGCVFTSLGENGKAIIYYEKALAIRIEIGERKGEAADYGNLGALFTSLGDYCKAKEYHEKALAISMEIGDKYGQAADYGNLGTLFDSLGEYAQAKEHLDKALAIRREIGDRQGEAADYGNLGALFMSLGEHGKAKVNLEKALAMRIQIGDRRGEGVDYGNLGTVFMLLGEYGKAIEYFEKALEIAIEIGDREGEAANYGSFGTVFVFLGEYGKAMENLGKALVITKELGDRDGEATYCGNLGNVFQYLGEHGNAKKYFEKELAIRMDIGDRNGEATGYRNQGFMFESLREYDKAKENLEKALTISVEIGDKRGEATSSGELGILLQFLGEYSKAEEYLKKAISISKEIGDRENEFRCYCHLSMAKLAQKKILEASFCQVQGMEKFEDLRNSLIDNDQLKISFSDLNRLSYLRLGALFCVMGKTNDALYAVELGRARALADLMAAQYFLEKHIPSNMKSCVGIENIINKESNCNCLYISYFEQIIFLWILNTSGVINFRTLTVNENFFRNGLAPDLDDFFAKSIRSFGILPEDECEDRSLNGIQPSLKSSRKGNPAALRLVEDDDEETQDPEPSLQLLHKMIIAPVVDLLDEPEITIVPAPSLYQVPFAALCDENGKYLSQNFRIRIVPSLTTLKLIHDSPADYHSQIGALIVGDPDVGRVFYKGYLENFKPLPCARKEAEMIGRLLGVQPLLGEQATKHAVLQRIHSVSLIHFAAHGNAERGEIALSPLRATHQFPQDEDYLLTMSDISQVQLRAKLVVLSCCHSARGQIRAEGVVGIARAFLGSGARSVLVALWALGDRATEQLMNRFYEHLSNEKSASESLHEAMKWMRGNGYSEVCDWAPFVLIGDNVTIDFGKLKKKETTNSGLGSPSDVYRK